MSSFVRSLRWKTVGVIFNRRFGEPNCRRQRMKHKRRRDGVFEFEGADAGDGGALVVEAVEHHLDLVRGERADTGEGGGLVDHLGGNGAEGARRAVGGFFLPFSGVGEEDAREQSGSNASTGAGGDEAAPIKEGFRGRFGGHGRKDSTACGGRLRCLVSRPWHTNKDVPGMGTVDSSTELLASSFRRALRCGGGDAPAPGASRPPRTAKAGRRGLRVRCDPVHGAHPACGIEASSYGRSSQKRKITLVI